MKRILYNATHPEEQRVAIVDGRYLYDLDIEHPYQDQKKGNIYKGIVSRVEPSLEAAFVDYGVDRHGFLPFKEIALKYLAKQADPSSGNVNLRDLLREGQEIIVQVEKEERGNKGAALTTFVSLAGRYLVVMPNNPRAGGISRKVDAADREELRQIMDNLRADVDMGIILRTVAVGKAIEEVQWDLDYLIQLWEAIEQAAANRSGPFLIYQESNIISRVIRDYLRADVDEVIIDDERVYEEAQAFMRELMPQNLGKLKLYTDRIPLFSRYQVEQQISAAHDRQVPLPAGGSIVIDHTEALISIDINSARATQGTDIEDTALRTNLEAADEIARQLRLRDLGGLIVIDFIDMMAQRNQQEVENRLRQAFKGDRARVQIGHISRFGLLEMSRQRLGASLRETSDIVCPRCGGQGSIRSVESSALHILRLLKEEALKEQTGRLTVQVPVAVASYLLNEKRDDLANMDKELGVHVVVLPNPNLETPHHEIERTRAQDLDKRLTDTPSHELPLEQGPENDQLKSDGKRAASAPAVGRISRDAPPPAPSAEGAGLLARVLRLFRAKGGSGEAKKKPAARQQRPARGKASPQRKPNNRNRAGNQSQKSRQASQSQHPASSKDNNGRQPANPDRSQGQNTSGNKDATAQGGRARSEKSKSNNNRQRRRRGGSNRETAGNHQPATASKATAPATPPPQTDPADKKQPVAQGMVQENTNGRARDAQSPGRANSSVAEAGSETNDQGTAGSVKNVQPERQTAAAVTPVREAPVAPAAPDKAPEKAEGKVAAGPAKAPSTNKPKTTGDTAVAAAAPADAAKLATATVTPLAPHSGNTQGGGASSSPGKAASGTPAAGAGSPPGSQPTPLAGDLQSDGHGTIERASTIQQATATDGQRGSDKPPVDSRVAGDAPKAPPRLVQVETAASEGNTRASD